jgi:SAM-dependent methyltransferase
VVDVGAGTGEIGLELVRLGVPYLGLDESAAMLDVFRGQLGPGQPGTALVVADARRRWPADDGTAQVIFGSRSLHWIPPEHVAAEAFRLAAPPHAVLLVGRVERDPKGARELVRRKMRDLLRDAGYEGRSGGRNATALVDECVRRGGSAMAPRVVATWSVRRPTRAALDDWSSKTGLGGVDLPEAVKRDVIRGVARWAADALGDIDAPLESAECYTLAGVVLVGSGTSPAESP